MASTRWSPTSLAVHSSLLHWPSRNHSAASQVDVASLPPGSADITLVIDSITGDNGRLGFDPTTNCIGVAAAAVLELLGHRVVPGAGAAAGRTGGSGSGGVSGGGAVTLRLSLEKGLPLGSGLGSSAASAAAAAEAVSDWGGGVRAGGVCPWLSLKIVVQFFM